MTMIPNIIIDEWARAKRVVIGGAGWFGVIMSIGAFASGDTGEGIFFGIVSVGALATAASIKYRYRLKGGVAVYE